MKVTFPETWPIEMVFSKTAEQLGRYSRGNQSIFLDFQIIHLSLIRKTPENLEERVVKEVPAQAIL
jgi:hypothetical protein